MFTTTAVSVSFVIYHELSRPSQFVRGNVKLFKTLHPETDQNRTTIQTFQKAVAVAI